MTNIPNIQSGFFQAEGGTPLTPTGNAKRSEVDSPYITKSEFIESPEAAGMGITQNSSDGWYSNGTLDKILVRASSWVTRYCNQWFDTQTIDEYQTGFTVRPFNPRLVSVYTHNAPIQNIQGIWIQVLQWFIQIQTTPLESSYLQILPDWGVFKIVPLLSTAGSGTGSPIPAAILDKVPLGVLWYSYTFGYGTQVTGYTLTNTSSPSNITFQPNDYNYQLWAPTQTLNIYIDGVLTNPSLYQINYPNGIVTFGTDIGTSHVVTADFTTNNSIPYDIKYATIKVATKYIIQGQQNPGGFKSIGITGYNVSFGDEYLTEIKEMLQPFRRNRFTVL
jgi:hypothetical protein